MKYFGTPYPREGPPAPIYSDAEFVATPVGERCAWCGNKIETLDSGFMIAYFDTADADHSESWSYEPWHRRCFHLSTFGEDLLAIIEKENGPL